MSKSDHARAREHRLAAKLRENLRRRKEPTAGPSQPAEAHPKTVPAAEARNDDK
jgi:hypothetical protein